MQIRIKYILDYIYTKVVLGKQKAITAFLIAGVGTYIGQNGLSLSQFASNKTLFALAVAVIAHIAVYYKKNG